MNVKLALLSRSTIVASLLLLPNLLLPSAVLALSANNELATEQVSSSVKEIHQLIPAFEAKYKISRGKKDLGTGHRKLKYLDNHSAEFSYNTDMKWFILSDKRQELSKVKLEQQRVVPLEYSFQRSGTGPNKHYHWLFAKDQGVVKNQLKNEQLTLDYSQAIQDPLSYHLQQRVNLLTQPTSTEFSYTTFSGKGNIKERSYQFDLEETITLPYGEIKTVRYKREVKRKRKVTYVWFAPELDYMLVKIQQIKNKDEEFKAELIEFTQ